MGVRTAFDSKIHSVVPSSLTLFHHRRPGNGDSGTESGTHKPPKPRVASVRIPAASWPRAWPPHRVTPARTRVRGCSSVSAPRRRRCHARDGACSDSWSREMPISTGYGRSKGIKTNRHKNYFKNILCSELFRLQARLAAYYVRACLATP